MPLDLAQIGEKKLTPLWIIGLFIYLTEIVSGIAATQVTGTVQIAFAAFAIGFPILVAFAFFLILWRRPYVLYSPTEYGQTTDVTMYVKAISDAQSQLQEQIVEKSKKSQEAHYSSYLSFIVYIVHKQLERGRISEVIELFDDFEGKEEFWLRNVEFALTRSTLARLCGKREALGYLQNFRKNQLSFYEIAQYELGLLKYGKRFKSDEIKPPFSIDKLSIGIRKLWASLLAMCYLNEKNMEQTKYYFDMIKDSLTENDAFDAYAGIQIAIVAAALGETDITEKYFDVAHHIDSDKRYSSDAYPYVSLIAEHERALVNKIIGAEVKLKKETIQLLKGHSHVIARHSAILRTSNSTIETLASISKKWKKPLEKKTIDEQLYSFENHILGYAGTLFVGM